MRSEEEWGIIDLSTQNDALLSKWLWKLASEPDGSWFKTSRELYGIVDASNIQPVYGQSFFLCRLAKIVSFFTVSIQVEVGRTKLRCWTEHGPLQVIQLM